jgi:hypothetical protein
MSRIKQVAKEVAELQHAWTRLKTDITAECDNIIAAAGGEHDVIRSDTLTAPGGKVGSHSRRPRTGRGE